MTPQLGGYCSMFYPVMHLAFCFLLSTCRGCPALHSAEAEGAKSLAERQWPGGVMLSLFWDDPTRQLSGTALQAWTIVPVL